MSALQYTYEYVSRSLFKADRLTFALHLGHGMYPAEFDKNEWELFCGHIVPDPSRRRESLEIVPGRLSLFYPISLFDPHLYLFSLVSYFRDMSVLSP